MHVYVCWTKALLLMLTMFFPTLVMKAHARKSERRAIELQAFTLLVECGNKNVVFKNQFDIGAFTSALYLMRRYHCTRHNQNAENK